VESSADKSILENDRQFLQRLVEKRGAGKAETHPHDLRFARIDIDGAHDTRLLVVFWTNLQFVNLDSVRPGADRKAVSEKKVVGSLTRGRQRMRNVADFIAVAKPNDVGKVVLDDPQVIAVIRDVGRKKQRVAAANDALLALVGRVPVDFRLQLVSLDDLWRDQESFAKLGEESHVAVRCRLIVRETRVRELLGSARRSATHQLRAARIVPRLRIRSAYKFYEYE